MVNKSGVDAFEIAHHHHRRPKNRPYPISRSFSSLVLPSEPKLRIIILGIVYTQLMRTPTRFASVVAVSIEPSAVDNSLARIIHASPSLSIDSTNVASNVTVE
jgi:hypothetical protein